MAVRGVGQMPPLASSLVDPTGIGLLSEWITNSLPSRRSFADWQVDVFGSTNNPLGAPDFDYDGDGAGNSLEWLTGTDARNSNSVWRVSIDRTGPTVGIYYQRIADRGFEVQYKTEIVGDEPWRTLVPLSFSASNQPTLTIDFLSSAPSRVYRVRVTEQ
jgi:hypothetical protein